MRPKKLKKILFKPNVFYFKPRGVPLRELEEVLLLPEELSALHLKNILGLDQSESAKKMQTSQSTFQRILTSAYKKISVALLQGRAIRFIKIKDIEEREV